MSGSKVAVAGLALNAGEFAGPRARSRGAGRGCGAPRSRVMLDFRRFA